MLTKVQQEIVEAPLGASLVTAGAGSGKTRVLTNRISFLLDNGIPDWAIVALTFTNKAAKEMKERVERMRGEHLGAFLGTFHSFCVRFLRKNIECLEGYTKDFSIYDSDDTMKVIKEIVGKDEAKQVEYHLSTWKNEGGSLSEYECDNEEIVAAMRAYESRLKKSNALDFDDLLLKTLEVFEKCPDVLTRLQNKFKYILVDEFQDTNYVQYKIVRAIAQGCRNIMIVGDEDQCIYTWRGASIDNLKKFKADFDPKIYKLEQNFRSAKNIVELANSLIQNNTDRIQKRLFSELEEGQIEFKQHYDERAEAEYATLKIMEGRRDGYRLNDFCILVRINSLSRIFEEQFLRFNIPYVIWGGFKFYERLEVRQALAYLKHIVNPNDSVAFAEALSFPKRGIGEASLEKILKAEELTGKAQIGYQNFLEITAKLKSIDSLESLAGEFLKITGLVNAWKTGKEEDDRRIDNLYELMNAIVQFALDNPDATLSEYLQTVSINVGETGDQGDRVVISTIHGAKGLEFKNVFVVGLEDGIFPLERAKHSFSEMEEERRLLYVAITRAMDNLTLSCASSRFHRGERNYSNASRFIAELELESATPVNGQSKKPQSQGWGFTKWW
ncbi:MAG: ATP-dependent helicase [Firmicutes bacterium]|nr:ATP-dependent helicase [Bacillota bacterium]